MLLIFSQNLTMLLIKVLLINHNACTAAAMDGHLFSGKLEPHSICARHLNAFFPFPMGHTCRLQGGGHGRHSSSAVTLLALETTLQATESMHEKQNRHISWRDCAESTASQLSKQKQQNWRWYRWLRQKFPGRQIQESQDTHIYLLLCSSIIRGLSCVRFLREGRGVVWGGFERGGSRRRSVDPLLTSPSCFLRPHPPLVLPSVSPPRRIHTKVKSVTKQWNPKKNTRPLASWMFSGVQFPPYALFPLLAVAKDKIHGVWQYIL